MNQIDSPHYGHPCTLNRSRFCGRPKQCLFKNDKRFMTETQIKKQCDDHLKKMGWIKFRLRSVDGSGWPDSFYIRRGVAVFIEYKRPDGVVSDIQRLRIAEIQEQQFDVFVVDSLSELKKLKF